MAHAALHTSHTAEDLSDMGWAFVGIYPQPDQPYGLHNKFMIRGYKVADIGFDDHDVPTAVGNFALWVKMTRSAEFANCDCASYDRIRKPCTHDIELVLTS